MCSYKIGSQCFNLLLSFSVKPQSQLLLNIIHLRKSWQVSAYVESLWIKLLLDKAVDFKTQSNYPSRATRPLDVFKRRTGFHIRFSNLSHPGCPTSTDKPHLKQAVLRLSLWNSRGKGRQSEVVLLPWKLPLSSDLKRQRRDSHILFSWPFCNSISRT